MSIPTLPGITATTISSARITTRVLSAGDKSGTPVIFAHGNLTSATFWEETMLAMPAGYHCIALDQRGFGESDPAAAIDGARGLADMSDDVVALMDTLGIEKAHAVGHSMGGGVTWRLMMDAPERLLSATLVAPVSPFGFGGTKDAEGKLCAPDSAGSGGRRRQSAIHATAERRRPRRWRNVPARSDERILLEAALHISTRRRSAHIGSADAYRREGLPGRFCGVRELAGCSARQMGRTQWHGAQ